MEKKACFMKSWYTYRQVTKSLENSWKDKKTKKIKYKKKNKESVNEAHRDTWILQNKTGNNHNECQHHDRKEAIYISTELREELRWGVWECVQGPILWTAAEKLTRVLQKEIHSPAPLNKFNTSSTDLWRQPREKDLTIHSRIANKKSD